MIIKLRGCERIFQIISAVIESEEGDAAHSCIYFSLFAANISTDHFTVDAKARCGLAAYHLGEDDHVLCFGELSEQGLRASKNNFHCWIEIDDWRLDFMAPTFRSLMRTNFTARPRMFQENVDHMAAHPNDMTKAGDFFLLHNQELADEVLMPVVEHLGVQDLARHCSDWFKKTSRKFIQSDASIDQNGKPRLIQLKPVSIRSNW